MNMKNVVFLAAAALVLLSISSCYYDRESDLYPQAKCDVDSVKWSTTIRPIINLSCAYVGCHGGGTASGGIDLTAYAGVFGIAQNGSLVGSIEHQSNYTAMPNNNSKLPDCQITQIRAWVAAGSQQN